MPLDFEMRSKQQEIIQVLLQLLFFKALNLWRGTCGLKETMQGYGTSTAL